MLAFESLHQMKWESFREYVGDRYPAEVDKQASVIHDLFQEKDANNEIIQADVKKLPDILLLLEITDLWKEFDEVFNIDPNYKFWTTYMKLVEIMLDFVRAHRESDWKLNMHAL